MAEMPPPYHPDMPRPAKKSNTGLIIAIVIGAVALMCIVPIVIAGFAMFGVYKSAKPTIECFAAFDHVRQAIKDYAKDNDGKLPSAATWEDDIRPYFKKVAESDRGEMGPFNAMKVEGPWGCEGQNKSRTGMAFNIDLSGKKLGDIKDPRSTVLVFEVEQPGRNLHEKYKPRPKETSPKILGEYRGWVKVRVEGDIDDDMNFGKRDTSETSIEAGPVDVKIKTSNGEGGE
jgi:hypothetical protein